MKAEQEKELRERVVRALPRDHTTQRATVWEYVGGRWFPRWSLYRLDQPSGHFMGGKVFQKEWIILGRRVKYEHRDRSGMGRFGGGWNWQVGIQVGGNTVIINLLVAALQIDLKRRD